MQGNGVELGEVKAAPVAEDEVVAGYGCERAPDVYDRPASFHKAAVVVGVFRLGERSGRRFYDWSVNVSGIFIATEECDLP